MTVIGNQWSTTDQPLEALPRLFQQNFSPDRLRQRRATVAAAIGAGHIAVMRGAPSVGGMVLFRQTNEFYYLTGVEVPHAYLSIDGDTGISTLYLGHLDPGEVRNGGDYLHAEEPERAAELTGFERVQPIEQLARDLARAALKPVPPKLLTPARPAEGLCCSRDSSLYAIASAASDPWTSAATGESYFADQLRRAFNTLEIGNLSPVLDRMRSVKDDVEIQLLRRAGLLTSQAVAEAMRCTRPGVHEYELAAVANFTFLAGGARGEGYRAIIGGGKNAWHGHYGRLSDPLHDGDLVLMDHAADFAYYTSDIGRMWPVNGTYSPAQRTLYGFIVHYHRELIDRIAPGVDSYELMNEVREVMAPVIDRTAWHHPHHEQAARGALEFVGHMSHPVGMAVHDVGDYRSRPLEVGAVMAIDPMIWIPEELQYVRCEDTVVVTADGCEVLTSTAPLDCDEIELAMREDGILTRWDSANARARSAASESGGLG
ncbi:MAG: Xaa-Pro peptidase family protein [Ilumatobacteraceae bacterium]